MPIWPTSERRKCPRGHQRHRCPFPSPPPMRLYHIECEWLRLLTPGTTGAKSSLSVPNSVSDDCQTRKTAPNPMTDFDGVRMQSPANPCLGRQRAKRRQTLLLLPHAAPLSIAPPSLFLTVGPGHLTNGTRKLPLPRAPYQHHSSRLSHFLFSGSSQGDSFCDLRASQAFPKM